MIKKFDDRVLLREINNGDKAALHDLIDKYYRNIYSYCWRRTNNEQTALDLTQDIFLKLIDNISSYQQTGKFQNYLFTIAVNTCNDHYKKKNFSLVEYGEEEIIDKSLSLEEKAINDERSTIIKKALEELPQEQKNIIMLRFYHEMKLKDIALILEVPLPTVKTRLKLGIKKLKQILKAGDLL